MSPLPPRSALAVSPQRRSPVSEDSARARARKLECTVEALRDEVCAPRRGALSTPQPNSATNQSSSCLSFPRIAQLAEEQELCAALRCVAETALAAVDEADIPSLCTACQCGASQPRPQRPQRPPPLTYAHETAAECVGATDRVAPVGRVTAAERVVTAERAALAAAERATAIERVAATERTAAAKREVAAAHAAEVAALAVSNALAALDAERARTATLRFELAELQRWQLQEHAKGQDETGVLGPRSEAIAPDSQRRRRRSSGSVIPSSPGLRLIALQDSTMLRQLVVTRSVL